MEDGQDDNTLVIFHEENLVRESTSEGATDDPMHKGILLWRTEDGAKNGIDA